MIPLDDRGLLLGDGLFETLLAVDGRLARFEAHLDRMTAGCAVIGLPPPDRNEARRLCDASLERADQRQGRAAVRLTLTAGSGGRGLSRPEALAPRLFATASPAPAAGEPARLVTVATRRNDGSASAGLKSLSYMDNLLARLEAGEAEALMLNTRGEVACAAVANVFWRVGGQVFTPALSCGVLAGTTRALILAKAGIMMAEVAAPRAVLDQVDAVALTNSLTGARPVEALDERELDSQALADALNALLA